MGSAEKLFVAVQSVSPAVHWGPIRIDIWMGRLAPSAPSAELQAPSPDLETNPRLQSQLPIGQCIVVAIINANRPPDSGKERETVGGGPWECECEWKWVGRQLRVAQKIQN